MNRIIFQDEEGVFIMPTKKTIKFNHEKLGEITLNTTEKGEALYDRETTLGIFSEGIDYLYNKGLLTLSEKEKVESQLQDCNIELIDNLGSLCSLNYLYNKLTGFAKLTVLYIDENSKYLDKESMITGLLDQLCDAIVTVLCNEVNLKDAEKEFKVKGKEWEKYAVTLLPEKEIISAHFRNEATEYLTKEITEDRIEKLKEIYEYNGYDDGEWIDYFLTDYIEVVMSDLPESDDEKSLTPEEYVDDQIYIYEDNRRMERENQ